MDKHENLKVLSTKKTLNKKTSRLEKITILASNDEKQVKMECIIPYIGTYKDDNVIRISEILTVDKIFDLVEGENGWGINTNPIRKAYYSDDCYHMPDDFEVSVRKHDKTERK
jgi:hypothetical protein